MHSPLLAFLLINSIIAIAHGKEFPAPDGRYSVKIATTETGASHATLIRRSDPPVEAAELREFDAPPSAVRVLWSRDSRQVAVYGESGRSGDTRVFQVGNDRAHEFTIPDVVSSKLSQRLKTGATRIVFSVEKPVRWTEKGHLVLLVESRTFVKGKQEKWIDYSAEVTLQFDLKDGVEVIRRSRENIREKTDLK